MPTLIAYTNFVLTEGLAIGLALWYAVLIALALRMASDIRAGRSTSGTSMARRLNEFAHIIENLSTREVKARLACYLLREERRAGAEGEVMLSVGKGDLARLLGTTAESLSRALRTLAEAGAIRVDGKRIALVDTAALDDLAAD